MFFISSLNLLKLIFRFIEPGNVFHTGGINIWKTLLPHMRFYRRNLKILENYFRNLFYCPGMFIDFFQVIRPYIIDIFESMTFNPLINSQAVGFERLFRYMIHFVKFYAEANSFILCNLQGNFKLCTKLTLPLGTRIIKRWLYESIAMPSS